MGSPAAALVRDLHAEALAAMYRPPDEDGRVGPSSLARVVSRTGDRTWLELDEPDADDHRVAHLEREVRAVAALQAPVAIAVASVVLWLPDCHETVCVWAAEAGGETLAMRVRTVCLWDGVRAPGPVGDLDPLEAGLAPALVEALRDAGGR